MGVMAAKIGVITAKIGLIIGHWASHDFWGWQSCSPPRGADNPLYAAENAVFKVRFLKTFKSPPPRLVLVKHLDLEAVDAVTKHRYVIHPTFTSGLSSIYKGHLLRVAPPERIFLNYLLARDVCTIIGARPRQMPSNHCR